jgi:hypothetical protein
MRAQCYYVHGLQAAPPLYAACSKATKLPPTMQAKVSKQVRFLLAFFCVSFDSAFVANKEINVVCKADKRA